MATLTCVRCGELFEAKRPDARACSTKCRVALSYKRKHTLAAPAPTPATTKRPSIVPAVGDAKLREQLEQTRQELADLKRQLSELKHPERARRDDLPHVVLDDAALSVRWNERQRLRARWQEPTPFADSSAATMAAAWWHKRWNEALDRFDAVASGAERQAARTLMRTLVKLSNESAWTLAEHLAAQMLRERLPDAHAKLDAAVADAKEAAAEAEKTRRHYQQEIERNPKLFTLAEKRLIRSCLHGDRKPDPERLRKAFQAFARVFDGK